MAGHDHLFMALILSFYDFVDNNRFSLRGFYILAVRLNLPCKISNCRKIPV